MEFHRYEYQEFDMTTYYAVEHDVVKGTASCVGNSIEKITVGDIPKPVNSEEIAESDLPESVKEKFSLIVNE